MYEPIDEIMRRADLPKLKNRFIELLRATKREGIEDLIIFLESSDFFNCPASARFHSSHEGGLLEHSLNVYERLKYRMKEDELYKDLGYTPETIAIVALLHDVCKTNCYKIEFRNIKDEDTGEWIKTPIYIFNDEWVIGHGEKSVIMIQRYIKLTDEEILAIRYHMGAFMDGEANNASKAFEASPLALALHIADEEATNIIEKVEKI